jgi:hypothetical protein
MTDDIRELINVRNKGQGREEKEMENINTAASFNRFGSGGAILRARVGSSLEDEQIGNRCPSVFADHAHDSRSDRYTYLPTRDLLAGLRAEGFFPVEVRQGGSRDTEKRGFTKHMIRLRRDLNALRQVGDSVPEVVLLNSHDGTSSYQFFLGWFRLVCLNGMVVADGDKGAAGIKVGHRGEILGEVIEASYRVINEAEAIVPLIEDMTHTELTRDEQLTFASAARELRLDDDAEIPAERIINPRRTADVGNDLWRVFNRAQENLVRGGIRYDTRDANNHRVHRHVREVKSIDSNVKLNRALWTLATEMQKIKRAA